MKKLLALLLCLILAVSGLSACKSKSEEKTDKIKIVVTTFPAYDWVRTITKGNEKNVDITFLLDNGVDLHSYQPSTEDMVKISNADLFIYVGGPSDNWVKDALANAKNKKIVSINMVEALGDKVKNEQLVEGMEDHDHDHDGDHHDEDKDDDHDKDKNHDDKDKDHDDEHMDEDHDKDEHHDEEHEDELDEHVWLSFRNAEILADTIKTAMIKIDPDNEKSYKDSTESFIKDLKAVDSEYKEVVSKAKYKTLLVGDRFPFRYLVDDYGLSYFAAFSGCSAETEASFETVSFLSNKLDNLNLNYVVTIESSDKKLASTIISNSKDKKREILTLNSMQSITSKDVDSGVTYLSIAKDNLKVLEKALN